MNMPYGMFIFALNKGIAGTIDYVNKKISSQNDGKVHI